MSDSPNDGENAINLVTFNDSHAEAFKQLNVEWLERYELLEPGDMKYLDAPRETILDRGGRILIAMMGAQVVGTCALVPRSNGEVELVKLAVATVVRGHGLGRRLTLAALALAHELGSSKVILVSSSRLRTALGLYESLGFTYGPLPSDVEYATADRYMELALDTGGAGGKLGAE